MKPARRTTRNTNPKGRPYDTLKSRPTDTGKCGTLAGNMRHWRKAERLCQPCADARYNYLKILNEEKEERTRRIWANELPSHVQHQRLDRIDDRDVAGVKVRAHRTIEPTLIELDIAGQTTFSMVRVWCCQACGENHGILGSGIADHLKRKKHTTLLEALRGYAKDLPAVISGEHLDQLIALSRDNETQPTFICPYLPQPKDANKTRLKDQLANGQPEAKCNACKTTLKVRQLELDRIMPRTEGGRYEEENVQLLCGSCNSVKQSKSNEFLLTALRVRGIIDADGNNIEETRSGG